MATQENKNLHNTFFIFNHETIFSPRSDFYDYLEKKCRTKIESSVHEPFLIDDVKMISTNQISRSGREFYVQYLTSYICDNLNLFL